MNLGFSTKGTGFIDLLIFQFCCMLIRLFKQTKTKHLQRRWQLWEVDYCEGKQFGGKNTKPKIWANDGRRKFQAITILTKTINILTKCMATLWPHPLEIRTECTKLYSNLFNDSWNISVRGQRWNWLTSWSHASSTANKDGRLIVHPAVFILWVIHWCLLGC